MTMNKQQVLSGITTLGLVPVVRAESDDEALRIVGAIREGGVHVLEITMTVPGALGVIETLAARFGEDVIVGAGTVLDAETATACIGAGARFIVSPALNLETVAACRSHGVPVMPGALTPTEVLAAWTAGADIVKVFPCGAVGGPNYLKALKAPFPQISLMPTGGVSLGSAAEFIRAGAVALGVGADLVDVGAIRAGSASLVTARAREFVRLVQESRVARTTCQ